MYESFAEGDIHAVVASWDSTIELREPEGSIGGRTLHGQDEILENLFAGLANDWTNVSVIPERFVDGGDTVVATITWGGTYTETGKSVEFYNPTDTEIPDSAVEFDLLIKGETVASTEASLNTIDPGERSTTTLEVIINYADTSASIGQALGSGSVEIELHGEISSGGTEAPISTTYGSH